MKARLLCLAALLALTVPAFATLGDNGMKTYDGRSRQPNTVVFGNQQIVDLAASSSLGFVAELAKGTFKPVPNQPATEPTELHIECLNSVAPPPLNWKMWCPSDAKIMQWNDKSGALHRQITIRPQAGMTSTMYIWWIISHLSGIMPPVVEFEGNKYYYYHLWHPLDHVESAWKFGPTNPFTQKGLPIYALIHERYRAPPSGTKSGHNYETNGWFFADDGIANLMKNRFVIRMPLLGIPMFTMILEFNDTPAGLVVDVEMIAGLPYKGFDERSPLRGYLTAAGMNEMALAPQFAGVVGDLDWNETLDAVTRHVVEEFTNLQFFVPYFWNKYAPLGKAGINWIPTLGTWMQNNKISINDGRSISFYHILSAISQSLINKEGTTVAAAVDAAVHHANGTYQAATAAATAVVVGKSQAYVQPSNAVTAVVYEHNKASGSHPEAANTYPGVHLHNQTIGVTVDHGANHTKPLSGLQGILNRAFLHEVVNSTDADGGKRMNIRLGINVGHHGHNHTFGK